MPDVFFDPEGSLPESVTLEFTRPPIYPQLENATLARHLAGAVERHVRNARKALAQLGRKFLGAKAVRQLLGAALPSQSQPDSGRSDIRERRFEHGDNSALAEAV